MSAGSPPPDQPRARARKGVPRQPTSTALARQVSNAAGSQREARVLACIDRMRAGTFERGKTGAELAAEWGMARSSVEHITAEAWRRYCAERSNPHELRSTALDWVYEAAEIARVGAKAPAEGESSASHTKNLLEGGKILLAVAGPDPGSLPTAFYDLSLEEQGRRIEDARAQLAQAEAVYEARKAALAAHHEAETTTIDGTDDPPE